MMQIRQVLMGMGNLAMGMFVAVLRYIILMSMIMMAVIVTVLMFMDYTFVCVLMDMFFGNGEISARYHNA